MIHLFCGHDARESAGFHTFVHSVIARASQPVSIVPLAGMGLPQGSNAFTLSRFLVPHLMGYKGRAIFADASDMLMLGDVADLDALFDDTKAVQVVKHSDYTSQHERKYIGTDMECGQSNYSRKNWASVMLMNCEHPSWRLVTREIAEGRSALVLLQLSTIAEQDIGSLPPEWNVLIDEGQADKGAKLLHWTAGIPSFKHYQNARRSRDWFAEFEAMSQVRCHG